MGAEVWRRTMITLQMKSALRAMPSVQLNVDVIRFTEVRPYVLIHMQADAVHYTGGHVVGINVQACDRPEVGIMLKQFVEDNVFVHTQIRMHFVQHVPREPSGANAKAS